MDRPHILVVDDEEEILDMVEIYLKNEGFAVSKAKDGVSAISALDKQVFHLILLDLMMPGMDGLEACRAIRKDHNIPIIMLTAKSEDIDKIVGLSTGADDYITKPFNPVELIARIRAQLRRYLYLNPASKREPKAADISFDGLTVNPDEHVIRKYGEEVSLTPLEFDILLLMMKNKGRVFSTEEIFERIWKERYFDSNNTVAVHIRKIREKIEDDPRKPHYIKTVWGVGYKVG